MRNRNKKKLYIFYKFIPLLIILFLFGIYAQKVFVPAAIETGEQKLKILVSQSIQDALLERDGQQMSYDDWVITGAPLHSGRDSLQLDMEQIEKFKIRVREQAERRWQEDGEMRLAVRAAALVGGSPIRGGGPWIHLDLQVKEAPHVEVFSEFADTGEGSTQHTLWVRVEMKAQVSPLWRSYVIATVQQVPIAEAVMLTAASNDIP